MKRLLIALCALLPVLTGAATLAPVQLLNPAGSAAGQAIVSTGSSTAPGWAAVSATSLAPVAANTTLGNKTGSSAAPTAMAMPSCSTTASALNWTTSTGFTCNTTVNAAQLNGATFAAPGAIGGTTPGSGAFTSITASSTITPSQTAGIVGTTTNNNANAGSVGEFVSNTTTGVSTANNIATNITSISLTAGDWDVWASSLSSPTGATITLFESGISTTSVTIPGTLNGGARVFIPFSTTSPAIYYVGTTRLSLSGTTTVYLVVKQSFGAGSATADAFLGARRVR